MKSITFACTIATLSHPNLSHMDFPDAPAAIHSSRTLISKLEEAASPNELMHPEISMKKNIRNIHIVARSTLSWPLQLTSTSGKTGGVTVISGRDMVFRIYHHLKINESKKSTLFPILQGA